ncbi:hypothetical protein WISP_04800 [Willisornis vidua]|uniref:Uncharacterized protein n=1 Tax=Willisornis vidua TaxID=1566151 RepID=A0ABQ9DTX3_9PASS|nr:hypothetical protein WISP_04800 [Willisornis vidua]
MPDHPFHGGIPPHVQPKPSLVPHEAIASCPITDCLGENDDSHLATTSFQVAAESDFCSEETLNYTYILLRVSTQLVNLDGSKSCQIPAGSLRSSMILLGQRRSTPKAIALEGQHFAVLKTTRVQVRANSTRSENNIIPPEFANLDVTVFESPNIVVSWKTGVPEATVEEINIPISKAGSEEKDRSLLGHQGTFMSLCGYDSILFLGNLNKRLREVVVANVVEGAKKRKGKRKENGRKKRREGKEGREEGRNGRKKGKGMHGKARKRKEKKEREGERERKEKKERERKKGKERKEEERKKKGKEKGKKEEIYQNKNLILTTN